ncbi:MAG: GNAT family N-acetyltransferase [Actinomycetota bacterium]|nr:GNAT family N-acetyltransferase [Actinomycetota bacterium]
MTVPLPTRDATGADNDALLALTAACPMEGDIGLCLQRRPDFFALNRLEGSSWRVGVVDDHDGAPIGCIAVAERQVYLQGKPTRSMYVSDLKVHPTHRGRGAAEALTAYARRVCDETGGPDIPLFFTVLAGNASMQRRLSAVDGSVIAGRVATLRAHSVPLLWRRRTRRPDGDRVTRATEADVGDMAQLWQRVAPMRQFAPVHDSASFSAWVAAAPGLDLSCYLLARDRTGALLGFVGMWDQSAFKQLQVTSYSPSMAAFRAGYNAAAPAFGAARLAGRGGFIRSLNAVNVCVPSDRSGVLRSLLLAAYDDHRGQGCSFLNIGLSLDDPLTAGVRGLMAQHTDVLGLVAGSAAAYTGRPLHHEIALV